MKFSWGVYLVCFTIFLLSFGLTMTVAVPEIFKGLSALPGIGSLFFALYQIWRDRKTHERQLELQRQQQFFNLGVASHMSNVVFDKYVEFCEKYLKEVDGVLAMLIQENSPAKAKDYSRALAGIRLNYYPWLSSDINTRLLNFERALGRWAFKSEVAQKATGKTSQKALDEADLIWDELLGDMVRQKEMMPGVETTATNEKSIANIKEKIRELLGTEQLTDIRKWVVSEAVKHIKS